MTFQYENYIFKIKDIIFNDNIVRFEIYEKTFDDNGWLEYLNLFTNVRDGVEVTISFNDYSMVNGYDTIGNLITNPTTEFAAYLSAVEEMKLYLINNPMSRVPEIV